MPSKPISKSWTMIFNGIGMLLTALIGFAIEVANLLGDPTVQAHLPPTWGPVAFWLVFAMNAYQRYNHTNAPIAGSPGEKKLTPQLWQPGQPEPPSNGQGAGTPTVGGG